MKYSFVLLITIVILSGSCKVQKGLVNDQENKPILDVENGLSSLVLIQGDSTWNIEERMQYYGIPGVTIAVIKDFKIDWVGYYGIKDKVEKLPVTEATLFQAGSISKPVAAYAALKTVDLKKIDLNKDVNTYLDSWKIPNNNFTLSKSISLAHLLSHTGGVTVQGFSGYGIQEKLPDFIQILNGESPANSPAIEIDEYPGVEFRYSGGGYCIVQQLLTDVYGKNFPTLMKELVLDPLGMSSSTFKQQLPDSLLRNAADGYTQDGSLINGGFNIYPEMAAAGLWTTASDLASFVIDIQSSLQNGMNSKILSKELSTKMMTPFLQSYMGLGIFILDKGEEVYFQHGGWNEGFSSQFIAHRDKGYGVVVLSNSNQPNLINEVIRSVARVYQWDNFLSDTFVPLPIIREEKDRIMGRYKYNDDNVTTILEKNNRIYYHYIPNNFEELIKIDSNLYIRRENSTKITFKEIDGEMTLVFLADDGARESQICNRLQKDEKVPYELLFNDSFEKGLNAYKELRKKDSTNIVVQESRINSFGYSFLYSDQVEKAIQVFKINIELHPASPIAHNALGEAYIKIGAKEEAIQSFRESLKIKPDNRFALKKILELEK